MAEHRLADVVELTGPRPQGEVIGEMQSAAAMAAPCVIGADGKKMFALPETTDGDDDDIDFDDGEEGAGGGEGDGEDLLDEFMDEGDGGSAGEDKGDEDKSLEDKTVDELADEF